MKTPLVVFLFLVSTAAAFCQNRNSVWCFGDSAGIDFTNTNNPLPIISSMDGRGSCVSISDTVGNLKLYAATLAYLNSDWDTRIYNDQHQIVAGCDSITGEAWYNELVVIPRPDFSNQYYVFSVGRDTPNNNGLFYTLIDMSLNGGLGQVVQQNIQLDNNRQADCLTAIKHANGKNWWIISKLSNTSGTTFNRFFVYYIDSNGISTPIIQDKGNATDLYFQKIVVNSNGTKLC